MKMNKNLLTEYLELKPTLTPKQKAERELDIWDSRTDEEIAEIKDKYGGNTTNIQVRSMELARMLDEPRGHITARHALIRAQEAALPLWEFLQNEEITHNNAHKLLSRANRLCKEEGVPREKALCDQLKEYLADRSILSHNTPSSPRKNVKKVKEATTRTLWFHVRSALKKILDRELSGVEPLYADKIKTEFTSELNALIALYQGRIQVFQDKSEEIVHRYQVEEACDVVHIDPPLITEEVPKDFEKKFKNAGKELLRRAHPDKNEGSHHKVHQYQEVVEALKILERFVHQSKGRK
jgi:hypothetical protein